MDIKLLCNDLIMKLPVVILLSASLQVSAFGSAQQVTLSFKNAKVETIFKAIQKQTHYRFIYIYEELEMANPVSIDVKKMPLQKALDICFENQPLSYRIDDNYIMVNYKKTIPQTDTLRNIKGLVLDENGNPLEGITVRVKRTGMGMATNEAGEFELHGLRGSDALIFSGVNSETKELIIGNSTELIIRLSPKIKNLGGVTVSVNTGYQQIPKERATGSFDFIDNKQFNRAVSTDVLSRLQGLASGMLFDANTGNDINISIRGRSTLFASTQPLIVLDNFEYNGDINNINPNDVESITVLKDAAAASIWGAKSGNGVIVITTKKGKYNSPTKVSFNSNLTITGKPDLFYMPLLDAADYIGVEKFLFAQGYYDYNLTAPGHPAVTPVVEILNVQRNGNITAQAATDQINTLQNLDVRNDLLKYFYRPAINQQYAINLSGGSKTQSYYLSAGYDKNLYNQVGNQYNRLSLNASNSYSLLKDKLEISTGLLFTKSITEDNGLSQGLINFANKALYPYAQLADANGQALPIAKYRQSYIDTAGGGLLLDWNYRPLDEIKLADKKINGTMYDLQLGLKYKVLNNLSVNLKYLYRVGETDLRHYYSQQTYFTRNLINQFTQLKPSGIIYPLPLGGILDINNSTAIYQNFRTQLDYTKDWNKNHISSIAGMEIQDANTNVFANRMYGYDETHTTNMPVDLVNYYPNYINGSRQLIPNTQRENKLSDRYLSFYLNAAYSFADRYTVSASGRRDASNLFGVETNQKWVPLWSAGISWNLSREKFYHINFLPLLKFGLTYGYNGNIDKSVTALLTTRLIGTNSFSQTFANINNPPNPNLRWERGNMINGRIEFALKNDQFTGSIEYYIKKGVDLIGSELLAPSTGISSGTSFLGNSAAMKGSGMDFVMNTKILNGTFKWNTTFLFSISKNRVTSYLQPFPTISSYILPTAGFNPKVGGPANAIYSFKWAGLDQEGNPQGYLGGKISDDYAGIINSSDASAMEYSGTSLPTVFGSLMNTFSWKSFTLSFVLSYKLGYNFRRSSIDYYNLFHGGSPGHKDFGNRWQAAGDELRTNVPSMVYPADPTRDQFYLYSSTLVTSGNHIRLQDIQCSYELFKTPLQKAVFKHIRVFVYASNLGIIWRANKLNLDPDYSSFIYTYPPSKSFATGVTIDF